MAIDLARNTEQWAARAGRPTANVIEALAAAGVDAPPAFHLLAKPTGAVCNLDCSYCFFLSKEMLYPGSRFRMAEELLDAYIRQLIEAHARVPEVAIAWQGGEPTLMGVEFFRRSVEIANRYLSSGQRATYTIQTNGTLVDPEWAGFFRENDVLVGISIDGPQVLHDAYRVNKDGKGSFAAVMRGLGHLRDAGVDWNVLTTVHAANGDHGREVYRFLRDDCGASYIQFIPIIERTTGAPAGDAPKASWRDRPLYLQEGSQVTSRSVTAEQYGRFLIDVFEEWVRRDVGEVYVQMFDVALANWVGEPPGLCVHSETCGLALALERTGETPDGDPGLNYLCAGFKAFFHHIDDPMRTMSRLLAEGRAPSEIVRIYAGADAYRGRNDPCSCGSGRKWKHCHGGPAVLATATVGA
jgi:uncharacterized protein